MISAYFVPIVVTTNLTCIRNSLGIGYFSLACKYNNYNNSHLLYCKCTSSYNPGKNYRGHRMRETKLHVFLMN